MFRIPGKFWPVNNSFCKKPDSFDPDEGYRQFEHIETGFINTFQDWLPEVNFRRDIIRVEKESSRRHISPGKSASSEGLFIQPFWLWEIAVTNNIFRTLFSDYYHEMDVY